VEYPAFLEYRVIVVFPVTPECQVIVEILLPGILEFRDIVVIPENRVTLERVGTLGSGHLDIVEVAVIVVVVVV
jgi:hypothetical protein